MIVLLRQFLLPYILPVLRWIPLLEKGGEPHCEITGLNTLHSTIQSPVAREEKGVTTLHWIERGTSLIDLALPLLCVSAEGTSKFVSHSSLKLMFTTRRQGWSDDINILFCDSHL